MLIFISWSGQRSKTVAEALESWLAQVIQAVEPWISQDIDKGLRWGAEIADRLEHSKVGIICLAKSNLDSKWIHFEAGALSKTKDAYVCTLLLDIKPSDVEQPLAQFQHTTTEKDQIFKLLSTINGVVQTSGEKSLPEARLRDVFETYWPRLEGVFQKSATLQDLVAGPSRTENEMLQEILEILRNQERQRHSIAGHIEMPQTLTSSMSLQIRIQWLHRRAEELIKQMSDNFTTFTAPQFHELIKNIYPTRLDLYKRLTPDDKSSLIALRELDEKLFELESMYLNALKTVYSEAEHEAE